MPGTLTARLPHARPLTGMPVKLAARLRLRKPETRATGPYAANEKNARHSPLCHARPLTEMPVTLTARLRLRKPEAQATAPCVATAGNARHAHYSTPQAVPKKRPSPRLRNLAGRAAVVAELVEDSGPLLRQHLIELATLLLV